MQIVGNKCQSFCTKVHELVIANNLCTLPLMMKAIQYDYIMTDGSRHNTKHRATTNKRPRGLDVLLGHLIAR